MKCPFCSSELIAQGCGSIIFAHPTGSCAMSDKVDHVLVWETFEDAAAQVRNERRRPGGLRTVSRRYDPPTRYQGKRRVAPMVRIVGRDLRSIGLDIGDRFQLTVNETAKAIIIKKETP